MTEEEKFELFMFHGGLSENEVNGMLKERRIFIKEEQARRMEARKLEAEKELLEEFRGSLLGDTAHSPKANGWFEGVKRFFGDV